MVQHLNSYNPHRLYFCKCTINGCNKEFQTYEEFSKHVREFHGIDEM